MARILLIGTAAGIASAILFASILSGSMLALALCILSPLPIMIVALGWAHRAGLAAALTAAAIMAGAFGVTFGLTFALTTAGPAWGLSYLVMLARRNADGSPEWFPIGHVVAVTALIGAAVGIVSALSIGTTYETYSVNMRQAVEAMLRAVTSTPEGAPLLIPDVDDPAALVTVLAFMVPILVSTTWVYTTLFNLWLAGRIVRTSGRLARPWPDLPGMRLPRWLPPILAMAVAAALLLSGMLELGGRIASAALLTPFTILGYAALHDITRGVAGRAALLGALYGATFILNWIAVLVVTLFGILDHLIDIRGRIAARRRPANDNR